MLNSRFKEPVLIDNRNLRKQIPQIETYFKELDKEANSFPKVNGLVVDERYVKWRNCPVCDCKETDQLFVKWGFVYTKCPLCTHVFIKNAIREDAILELYSTSKTDQIDRAARSTDAYQVYWQKMYAKYLDVLQETGVGEGKLIDVGAGSGLFLDYCKRNSKYELFGTEYSADSKDFIVETIGIDHFYYQIKLEDTDFGSTKFNVVTLWGVLEHIYNPLPFLTKCGSILDDKGVILVLVPNFNSRAIQILGITTPTLNPRGHIQNFNDESMKILCRQAGLKIVETFGELPVIDLMYDHLDYSDALVKDIMDKGQSYYKVYLLGKRI